MPSTPKLQISEHRLENGLRVILHPDRRLPLAAVNLWYHVGSKNEVSGRTGLAHLFEHMLFQGSENIGTNDHFRHVQQVGGVANGSTWYDRTNYYETVPSSALELALWLESDRMGFLLPALTHEKLENQREVVMNERRQRVDNQPYGTAFEVLNEMLYPEGHPYRWPVIGYMEDIEAATYDDVANFFRKHYAPNRAVLTLAGDFEESHALELVSRYFGDLAAQPAPDSHFEQPSMQGAPSQVIQDHVPLERFYLAFRGPKFGSRDWFIADLLSTAWSQGKSSTLYQDLVYERQMTQDVAAFVFPTELEATFALVATVAPEVPAAEVEKRLHEHLFEGPGQITETQLAGARSQLLSQYFEDLQSIEHRADVLSMYATYLNDPHQLHAAVQAYNTITVEDIQQFADHYLRPDALASLRVDPLEAA